MKFIYVNANIYPYVKYFALQTLNTTESSFILFLLGSPCHALHDFFGMHRYLDFSGGSSVRSHLRMG